MPKKAGKRQKKGQSGDAAMYVTRNQALEKLQLDLPEFRKLCILKGIYPREPKKAVKGRDKTYFLNKDILYLQHDPILVTFRQRDAWKKKYKKAKAKNSAGELELLKERKPRYSLNHVVRERYPTFVDALRDLDDPLCLVFLFARMPSNIRIHTTRIDHCRQLAQEFQYYVYKTSSLRKVFVSIKGIYYQADILGQTVTWLVPHQFTQTTVQNVDYKVMLSFLEFYEILLSFINFKLYSTLDMSYPPALNKLQVSQGRLLSAVTPKAAPPTIPTTAPTTSIPTTTPAITPKNEDTPAPAIASAKDLADLKKQQAASKARLSSLGTVLGALKETPKEQEESDEDSEEESDEESAEDSDEDSDDSTKKAPKKTENTKKAEKEDEAEEEAESEENDMDVFKNDDTSKLRKKQEIYSTLFKNCIFWLGREVPKESLEFVIVSFGGKAYWDGGELKENDPSITHQLVDRPKLLSPELSTREYVQPQWVYDSVNTRLLIPCHDYGVGKTLPPHLSPFVDDVASGYVPEYKLKLDEYYQKEYGESLLIGRELPQLISEESDDEEEFANDLEAEKKGNYEDKRSPPVKRKRSAKAEKEEEERDQAETAAALLPKKKRKVLEGMKRRKRMHEGTINKLEDKKLKLATGEAKINSSGVIEYQ